MILSKRDKMLLLIVLGIAVFLVCYLGVTNSFNNKRLDVESQISALTPRLTELKSYSANLSNYQAGIKKCEETIGTEMQRYPDDARTEDVVVYADKLADSVGLDVSGITVAEPEFISLFNVPEENSDSDSSELVPMAALRTEFTIECTLSYKELKALLTAVYDSSEMTTVKSVEVSFDSETGQLNGTIILDKYFIASKDYAYAATEVPPVATGTDDLFGTFSVNSSGSSSATPPASANGSAN